jgi:hypothetical protein
MTSLYVRVKPQVIVATMLTLTIVFWWSTGSAKLSAYPEAVALPVAPGTMEACELMCWEGACDSNEHDAFDSLDPEQWDAIRNGGAHVGPPLCRTGTCDTMHGPLPCDPYVGLPQGPVHVLEALRLAILESDSRMVAEIVEHASGRVSLNTARSAVQVTGCRGGIVAHMPLSADFLRLVQEASTGDN